MFTNRQQELRLADYNQGRRYGNGSGQAGAFGASTGFGGFGQTNTQNTGSAFGSGTGAGLFGSQATTSASPFGGSGTQTTGSFGGGGTSLFGASKPATGGLFGSTPATSAQSGGGLFGTAGTSGFGNTQNTGFGSGTTSGGLFGGNQQQPKSGFSFGGTNTSTSAAGTGFGTAGGFGGGTTAGGSGGLFGSSNNQAGSLFGSQQQQQQPAPNPFGQPAQTPSGFGGFGNNQPKTGGLFGTSTTVNTGGGGLFGAANQTNQQSSTNNPFGGTTNQNTANNPFAPKPAATGTGGLFGNIGTSNTTGGLFGSTNNQNQQNQTGGLFSTNTQQQQQPTLGGFGSSGGLFGNNTANNNQTANTGSLFGAQPNNQNQQSGGLFGNSNNSSTLFGNSQQNTLRPPVSMTASIMDRNPYGSSSIFSGLPPPPQTSPGPIATPISAGHKQKKHAPLPQYKINPTMASRLVTPQKRGFGFSYSTYGTPSSISSNPSTPSGLSSSLLGSSIGRSLGKSFSTSNLRRTFDNDADSILSPGAFSTGSSRYSGNGSMKRLTIDRSLRTDLFGPQPVAALTSPDKNDQSRQSSILKKKVSFDATTVGGNGSGKENEPDGNINGASSSDSSATPSAEEQGFLRSSSRTNGRTNGARPNSAPTQPEMEQVKGNELAIVHEDEDQEESSGPTSQGRQSQSQLDPQPGQYYMRPSREELRKLPKDKLKKVSGFTVGREHCGHVVFDQPVDLTTVDLDNIFGKIAVITLRSLTVYPQTDKKPPLGKGLNVPSTITLENSWPRQRDRKTPSYEKSGPKFLKHVDRLRKVTGTEFVKYNKETGEWVFRVPHFTTYALDYDDTASEGDTLQSIVVGEAPDTPTPKSRTPKNRCTPMPRSSEHDSSMLSDETSQITSGPDDTFDFKKKRLFPGAYDDASAFEDDQEMEEVHRNGESFLGERSVTPPSENGPEEPSEDQEEVEEMGDDSLVIQDNEMEMAGAFPTTVEAQDAIPATVILQPKSILKASQQQSLIGFGTPGKSALDLGDPWAEHLQQTISPRKQDRQTLRESQARLFRETDSDRKATPTTTGKSKAGKGFATSIDLMNSLFGKDEARKSGRGVKQGGQRIGFEV